MNESIEIQNLNRLSLTVKNGEEMLAFYQNVLGLPMAFETYLGETGWTRVLRTAECQYLELTYDPEHPCQDAPDRWSHYGYTKFNFAVDNIVALRDHLTGKGIRLDQDLHGTLDGACEIAVHDPDGNTVQFTVYSLDPLTELDDDINSQARTAQPQAFRLLGLTQAAVNVQHTQAMRDFYTKTLGLTLAATLTKGTLAEAMAKAPKADPKMLEGLRKAADQPWIDYIDAWDHQFIELFYDLGGSKEAALPLSEFYGFRFFGFGVEEAQAARQALLDMKVAAGPMVRTVDGLDAFWIQDPDGNKILISELE